MLHLYNTLTKQKEVFKPIDPNSVTLYSCGPTVWNYAHIGNGRSFVVFDTLNRLLRTLYPKVTFARNITDVDDKIIQGAKDENVSIDVLTKKYTDILHQDLLSLGCIAPDFEPKATDYLPQMIAMIERLIANNHAYAAEGHVLFSVPSYKDYGKLSGRNRDEQIAGARVDVAPYKKDPADFVLWKPSTDEQPGWDSPWGRGRPGWHIECSAMATDILGENFDIHGGGLDLTFPHHENELAQSCCANHGSNFANVWMHNGFLNINTEKMSKSLGNFFTVHELLEKYPGEAIRFVLLSAQYRQPLEFNPELLDEAKKTLDRFYRAIEKSDAAATKPTEEFLAAMYDDLNTPRAMAELHRLVSELNKGDNAAAGQLKACAGLLGLLQQNAQQWFQSAGDDNAEIDALIAARKQARADKNFAEADRIRDQLTAMNIILDDSPDATSWRRA